MKPGPFGVVVRILNWNIGQLVLGMDAMKHRLWSKPSDPRRTVFPKTWERIKPKAMLSKLQIDVGHSKLGQLRPIRCSLRILSLKWTPCWKLSEICDNGRLSFNKP